MDVFMNEPLDDAKTPDEMRKALLKFSQYDVLTRKVFLSADYNEK